MSTRVHLKSNIGKSTMKFLEQISGGRLTMARLLKSLRQCEGYNQREFAKSLGISRQNLCDIEKGRKVVSAARAAMFAQRLGYPPSYFIQLAIQEELQRAGLKIKVSRIEVA